MCRNVGCIFLRCSRLSWRKHKSCCGVSVVWWMSQILGRCGCCAGYCGSVRIMLPHGRHDGWHMLTLFSILFHTVSFSGCCDRGWYTAGFLPDVKIWSLILNQITDSWRPMVPKSCRQDPDPCNGNTWQRNTVDTKLESLESPMKSHEVPWSPMKSPVKPHLFLLFWALYVALELKLGLLWS